jgi:hypothetical protein
MGQILKHFVFKYEMVRLPEIEGVVLAPISVSALLANLQEEI